MRIAIAYQHWRILGGIETHLSIVIPALIERGHEVAFLHESDGPVDRPLILSSTTLPAWSVSTLGQAAALAALRNWRPQVIYGHGLQDPDLEAGLLDVAPVIFFAHAYHGTCISGAKSFKFPTKQPCDRQFGLACLAHYYPHRCGGLNPATMLRQYAVQSRRLAHLRQYRAVLVASSHMAGEYARHGCEGSVSVVPYPVPSPRVPAELPSSLSDDCCRLLFLGRMELLKGGDVLLAALPRVRERLGKELSVTLAGDGTERPRLEFQSIRLTEANPRITIRFAGWIAEDVREELLRANDLLVIPSVWPEPFGLVGVEAGHFSVPSAAFNVGGVPDWLKDGVNGHLASGQPPTAHGLADAIVACLSDSAHFTRLQRGAVEMARGYRMATHVALLEGIFENVLRSGNVTPDNQAIDSKPVARC